MLKEIGYLLVGSIVAAQLVTSGTPALAQTTKPATSPTEKSGTAQPDKKDDRDHPRRINLALEHLQKAQKELEGSGHQWGGHRKSAGELISQAQKELREALAYFESTKKSGTATK
jgi:hypothetical protein